MRPVPDCAIAFVKAHEGCKLTAYEDSGGLLTVGYGHTGTSVKAGQTIPQSMADLYLKEDLAIAAKRLAVVVSDPVIQELTDNQYAALISFVFNLGCQPGWTIWKVLNAQDFDRVPGEMMRFVNCGGKKVQGLVNRRAAEVALWATGEPGTAPDVPSSAVTRNEPTPPVPAKTDLSHIVTAIVGAVGAVPVAAKTVSDAVTPYADKSPLVAHLIAVLATVAAVATVVLLGLGWLKSKRATA